jgi:hypothetical protein
MGGRATVQGMSTSQRSSWALRVFVPAYLFVIGAGLLVAAVLLLLYVPDELFVAGMAGLGGLTMLGTMAAMLTVARNR